MDTNTKIIILSIIQGIADLFPISSNAHLIIAQHFMNFDRKLIINTVMHLGALSAIIIYLRKDIFEISKNITMSSKIILGAVPALFAGYFIHKFKIIDYEKTTVLIIIATASIIFAIILFMADKKNATKKLYKDLTFKEAFIIGLWQIMGLIPGSSRSGSALSGGRFLGYNRVDAAKFSFFISIPTVAGAAFIGILDLLKHNDSEFNVIAIFSFATSFVTSYLVIRFFFYFIEKTNLNLFVYYRVLLGIFLFYYYFFKL